MMELGVYRNRDIYDWTLKQKNYEVTFIDDLKETSNLETFNLLMLDLSGKDVEIYLPKIEKLSKVQALKIIIVKQDFTFEEMKSFMHAGVYDCLKLPVDRSTLLTNLEKTYIALQQEIRKNKKKTAYTLRSIRESLAYDLIHGNTKNAKEIWERSQLADLSSIPNIVLLVSIDYFSRLVENKGELWKSTLREETLHVMEQYDTTYQSLKVLVDQDKYAVLLALPVQADEESYKLLATEYAEIIRKQIQRKTNYTVTVGIGNYYEDARNLHLSYQESAEAQTYRLYAAENSIIHIQDLNYFKSPEHYEHKIRIQAISEKFSIGDMDAVFKEWEIIYRSVEKHHHFRPEEFRLQVLDLLFSLSQSAMKNGANPKSILPLQMKYAKELHTLESLAEIDQWIKEIIATYNDHVKEEHNEQVLKSVQEVLRYVEEHFTEDIGLDTAAEEVGLSPNYVSAIFKQTIGSSFTDYITERRMNRAKEDLKDLNVTIYEIAESVGYSSSQYFSRVFKNHEGMTPTAYRNSLLTVQKW